MRSNLEDEDLDRCVADLELGLWMRAVGRAIGWVAVLLLVSGLGWVVWR